MAIFRKDHLKDPLAELNEFYKKLRQSAEGLPPNPNVCHDYNCEVEQFQREFTDVDLFKLEQAIGHFKVAVDGLKTIKKHLATPNHKG